MSSVFEFFNKVHHSESFNRSTLGIDSFRGGSAAIRWRLTDLLYIVVVFLIYPLVSKIEPFQRQFFIDDLTISHPFAEHERVPAFQLFLYAAIVPLATVFIIGLVFTKPKNKIYVTYVSLIGIFVSTLTASLITDILKNGFGRHRPDFLARCVPRPDAPKGVLVYAKDVCTTENVGRLLDGFRTTPLGHSSISFAGLLYLSLWLSGQLAVTRPQAGVWRWLIAGAPTLGASLIALSRTEDYRHHFIDIITGLILGSLIAIWLYLRLFPHIKSSKSHEPRLLILEEEEELHQYSPV